VRVSFVHGLMVDGVVANGASIAVHYLSLSCVRS
jgi:hypothetical protein